MSKYTDLNYRLNTQNKDIKISKDSEAIKNSIRNILLIPKVSVPGLPNFGSDLYSILHEPMDEITFSIAEEIIRNALEEWEDRITIEDIDVDSDDIDSQLIIRLQYKIITTNEFDTVSVSLNLG